MAENNLEKSKANENSMAEQLGKVEELQNVATFFNKYKNYIFIGLGVIALGILAYMFIGKKGDAAKALKYEAALRQAQYYTKTDSFDLALNGNGGEFIGLLNIIKKAKGTTTEKLALISAGACYIGKNDGASAIKNLEQAKGLGKQVDARRLFLLGDAKGILAFKDSGSTNNKYLTEAIEYYKDAANRFPEDLVGATYLQRAVIALDKAQKYEDAKKICITIKEKYADNDKVIATIDKYLAKYGVLN